MHFNDLGSCRYKSGHLSHDGKYVRLHICSVCFQKRGEKKFHPAIDCEKRNFQQDYQPGERSKLTSFKGQDKKPCSYFNSHGNCRKVSGHYSQAGFTRQLHICSCCKEFRGEVNHHAAVTCKLKEKLTGGKKKMLSEPSDELPCHSFNAGKCVLQSGHHIAYGFSKMIHICKFCFDYRGEKKTHTDEECKLKKSLLQDVEHESQIGKYNEQVREEKKAEVYESNKRERKDDEGASKSLRE